MILFGANEMSLLRTIVSRVANQSAKVLTGGNKKLFHHLTHHHETPDETEQRYIQFFERPDIDGWDLRQGMTDLLGYDMVPDPKVVIAVMYACRRVNDYALAVRFLEAVKNKTGGKCAEIYPYIIQEIGPVICELGVDTPEFLGYDKPELYLPDTSEWH